jgi:hypothetical protein
MIIDPISLIAVIYLSMVAGFLFHDLLDYFSYNVLLKE